jgi:hypothetical protein
MFEGLTSKDASSTLRSLILCVNVLHRVGKERHGARKIDGDILRNTSHRLERILPGQRDFANFDDDEKPAAWRYPATEDSRRHCVFSRRAPPPFRRSYDRGRRHRPCRHGTTKGYLGGPLIPLRPSIDTNRLAK